MAYRAGCNWSDEEDEAIRVYYPSRGRSWDGWKEVLPERTKGAIVERARRLGIKSDHPRRQVEYDVEAAMETKRERWYYQVQRVPPKDPYEEQVVRLMHEGMTPTEIDRKMGWFLGSARLIMSNRWLRQRENAERMNERYRSR